ncbi:MAG: DUF393 domain-containing protein [Anaerolineales bacterium]|nr:DUF393 domain-containing protein [Anaerolineales bacterium]
MSQVIYDADCPICNRLKDYTEKQSRAEKLEFIAYQNAPLPQGLTRQQASQAVYLINPAGKRYRGARAIFELMRHMNGWQGWLGRILSLPPFYWLAEPFYRLFARHRHRVSERFYNSSSRK